METTKPKTIDEYIALAAPDVKEYLERMRLAVRQAAPEAQESISYEMPVYKQDGVVAYFGGFTKHVSLFPGPDAIAAFKEELAGYKTSRGTIQFPIGKPLPVTLIKKIVRYCVKANKAKAKAKKTKKPTEKAARNGKSDM